MVQKLKKALPWALLALALVAAFGTYRFVARARIDKGDPTVRVRGPNNLRIEMVGSVGVDLVVLAYENGLFENEGLLVDPVTVGTARKAVLDLSRQEVDLAVVGDVPLALLSPTGTDIAILAVIAEGKQDMVLITPKEGGIASFDDLRGKRLGVDDQDVPRYALDLFLARHHLSEEEVSVIPLKLKELPTAVRKGEVAGITDAFAESHHAVLALTKPTEPKFRTLTEPDLLVVRYCLVASRGIIQKKRPLLLKTLRALMAANEAIKSDPFGSAKLVGKGQRAPWLRVTQRWKRFEFGVTLGPSLLTSLDAPGHWAAQHNQDAGAPNWASMMAPELLAELRPEAVTLGK